MGPKEVLQTRNYVERRHFLQTKSSENSHKIKAAKYHSPSHHLGNTRWRARAHNGLGHGGVVVERDDAAEVRGTDDVGGHLVAQDVVLQDGLHAVRARPGRAGARFGWWASATAS